MSITSDSRTADLPTGVKDKVRDAKETAQAKIQDIKQHLHAGTEAVQDKADETTQLKKLAFVMDACRKTGLNKFSLQSR